MNAITNTDGTTPPRRSNVDRTFAWVLIVIGVGRIALALLRRETAGAEVGIATSMMVLAGYELVRIWSRNRNTV